MMKLPVLALGVLIGQKLEEVKGGDSLVGALPANEVQNLLAAHLYFVDHKSDPTLSKFKLQQGKELGQAEREEDDGEGKKAVGELVSDSRLVHGTEDSIDGKTDCRQLQKGKADDSLEADNDCCA